MRCVGQNSVGGFLVAAGVVLGRDENEPRTRLSALLLRGAAEGLEDTDHCKVRRDYADSDRYNHRHTENERHEERDQDQPPLKVRYQMSQPQPSHRNQTRLSQSTCVHGRR